MSQSGWTSTQVFNDAARLVPRLAAPWLGVLWLTALPLRFLQVGFVLQVLRFQDKAHSYGDYLWQFALLLLCAWLLALWGRSVWTGACLHQLRSGQVPGTEGWRVPPAVVLTHLYLALLLLGAALLVWMLSVPFALAFGPYAMVPGAVALTCVAWLPSIAAVAADGQRRPAPIAALGQLLSVFGGILRTPILLAGFVAGLAVAYVNVYLLLKATVWIGEVLLARPMTGLEHLLRPSFESVPLFPAEPLAALLVAAGAVFVVEPFWYSALSVICHHQRARSTGDDLWRRLETLRREAA